MHAITFLVFQVCLVALAIGYHHHDEDEREDGCKDNPWWRCDKSKNYVSCEKESMRRNCPVTCEACDECTNMIKDSSCERKTKYGGYFCRSKYAYMCRKSCGRCDVDEAVDGGWSEWSDWDECSASCGGGTTSRTRSCTNPAPEHGGKDCEGDDVEHKECGTDPCPTPTCKDNPWWKCEKVVNFVSCEKESMKRNCPMTCNACDYCTDMIGSYACQKTKLEWYCKSKYAFYCRKSCNQCEAKKEEKTVVDGGWTEWSDFDECSKTCGGGENKRVRSCTNPEPANGGKDCEGEAVEQGECSTNPCPVDGGWGDWWKWSDCSKSCGEGWVSRERRCDNPEPQHGGADCEGEDIQRVQCFIKPCDSEEETISEE